MKVELLAEGLVWPEGPAVLDDGSSAGTRGGGDPVGRLLRAELDGPGLEPFRGRIG